MGRVAETADAAQPPRDCGPPKRSAASYAKSLLLPFEPRVEGDGLNSSSLITSMSFFFLPFFFFFSLFERVSQKPGFVWELVRADRDDDWAGVF